MPDRPSLAAMLRPRFDALWSRAVGSGEPARAWERLAAGYGDPRRAYHDWRHVAAMLDGLDEARADPEFTAVRFDALELAVFFHDAVYDPQGSDNEAASAVLFAQEAVPRLGPEGVERVRALILATVDHRASDDPSTSLLIDLDLAVLGAPPTAYAAYASGVRREYAHVQEAAWRLGRAAVLRRFLARERIFLSRSFLRRFEAAARTNLADELVGLEG